MPRRGRDEGNIYQRSDGRWTARISLGYQGGRRVRKSLYGKTRKEVQDKLVAAQRSLQLGMTPTRNGRLTLGAYLEEWLAESVLPSVRRTTFRSYEQLLRVHVLPDLGRLTLAKLGPDDVQRLLNRKQAEGLSPRTVSHIRAVLRRALNVAQRWDLVPRNAAALASPPRVPRYQVPALDPEAARAILRAVTGDRFEALFVLALATGLRQGECLGLRWEDVDLDAGTLYVRNALQRVGGQPQLVEPKTSLSRRTLALPHPAVVALRTHRLRQHQDRLLAGARWRDQRFVFCTLVGTPADGPAVTRRFKHLLAEAGLPAMRFHDLRHGCASLLLAQGVSPRVVMEILGHSQISLTMNTYAHVIPSLKRDAAEQMATLLASHL